MDIIYFGIAALAGAGMAMQAGINARLHEEWAGSALLASCASFVVGALALCVLVVLTRTPVPALAGKTQAWQWMGGLCGAFVVTVSTVLAPRIGAASLLIFIMTGQLTCALILDHFGIVGYPRHELNWQRIVGVALVAAGAVLVRRF